MHVPLHTSSAQVSLEQVTTPGAMGDGLAASPRLFANPPDFVNVMYNPSTQPLPPVWSHNPHKGGVLHPSPDNTGSNDLKLYALNSPGTSQTPVPAFHLWGSWDGLVSDSHIQIHQTPNTGVLPATASRGPDPGLPQTINIGLTGCLWWQ